MSLLPTKLSLSTKLGVLDLALYYSILVLFNCFLPLPLSAEPARTECKAPRAGRFALVMGNASYGPHSSTFSPLPEVVRDREDFAKALCALEFTVVLGPDQTREEMKTSIDMLRAAKATNSLTVVYFSGHGLQMDGFNYLIPVGSQISTPGEIKSRAINMQAIYDALADSSSAPTGLEALIIIDACRSNHFSDMRSIIPGLAIPSDAPAGVTVAFATAPGTKALPRITVDGVPTRHSPYTEFLLKHIQQPGLTLPELFAVVRNDTIQATGALQVPWENSSALQTTYLANPVLVELRTLRVADLVEVRINGIPVLQDTYPKDWTRVTSLLVKPGRNSFEILVYKGKTFKNNNQTMGREGWRYTIQLRIEGKDPVEFSCSEENPPLLRWGQGFTAYSGFIEVGPTDRTVSMSSPNCQFLH